MGVHARPRASRRYQPRHATPPPPAFTLPDRARKAPPALAIAGLALTAAPHAGGWNVHPGDTLTRIAAEVYGHASDWGWLWNANKAAVSNPDLIYPGQYLTLPAGPPPGWVPPLVPRPRPAAPGSSSRPAGPSTDTAAVAVQAAPAGGTYSCTGLEALWGQAGGNPAAAFTAAEIAMAESGGNPDAISPTDDFGLWQVNGSHGALATLNPYGNARAAVLISGNGTNWGPWATFTSGAYSGKC